MRAQLTWAVPSIWAAVVLGVGFVRRPHMVRRPPGPDAPPRGTADRDVRMRLGAGGVALLVAIAVHPFLGIAAVVAGLMAPVLARRRAHVRHRAAVTRELPEVIDLLRLALAGGGSPRQATSALVGTQLGPVTRALDAVDQRLTQGWRYSDALEDVVAATTDDVRPLVRALTGAEHYGTELLPTLERLAGEARDKRRRLSQTAARRVPVRLLMPLVLCILPAFVLLTLVPTLASTFDSFGG